MRGLDLYYKLTKKESNIRLNKKKGVFDFFLGWGGGEARRWRFFGYTVLCRPRLFDDVCDRA